LFLKEHDGESLNNTISIKKLILYSEEKAERIKKLGDEMKKFLRIGKKFIDGEKYYVRR